MKENLNIVFIGHVDAGKSTMGGQILYVFIFIIFYFLFFIFFFLFFFSFFLIILNKKNYKYRNIKLKIEWIFKL